MKAGGSSSFCMTRLISAAVAIPVADVDHAECCPYLQARVSSLEAQLVKESARYERAKFEETRIREEVDQLRSKLADQLRDLKRLRAHERAFYRKNGPCTPLSPSPMPTGGIALPEAPTLESQGFVYFFADESRVKIGWSADPKKRLRALISGSGHALVPVGCVAGNLELERTLHKRFEHLRLHGEWFRPDPEIFAVIAHLSGASE
jgi:cell division protein FtsB